MTSTIISKDIVRWRLQSGEFLLQKKTNFKNCEMWANFSILCDAKTNAYVEFVQCDKCNTLYHLKGGGSTSSIGKHVKKCVSRGQMGLRDEGTTWASSASRGGFLPPPQSRIISPSSTSSMPPSPTPFIPPSPIPSPAASPLPSPSMSSSFSETEISSNDSVAKNRQKGQRKLFQWKSLWKKNKN